MDLKIKDVADLLNVSETTIRRWLSEGKIPAYRLNHQYRFSLIEIEEWVMRHKLGHSQEPPAFSANARIELQEKPSVSQKTGIKQFSLYRAIHKGLVLNHVPGSTKEELILNAIKPIAKELGLDAEVIGDLLLDREKLMSTSVNRGIAVPHPREILANLKHDSISVVFPAKPIAYGALDGKPVHTLFFLLSSCEKNHLHLLAKLAHLTQLPNTQALLEKHPTKNQLLEYVKEWESGISHPGHE